MNCPPCHQMIGHDQHAVGAWTDELDRKGCVIGSVRDLIIYCGHCGIFVAVEDLSGRIRLVRGPVRDPRELRRLERLIPSLHSDKRMAPRRQRPNRMNRIDRTPDESSQNPVHPVHPVNSLRSLESRA